MDRPIKERKVLDSGFVNLIDFMGSDQAILRAARVSTGAEPNEKRDRGLIRYLYRNRHTSPLEMCEFVFHVRAPIFVARQWVRHRTGSWNEMSGRYREMETDFYLPEKWKEQSKQNHQGADAEFDENAQKALNNMWASAHAAPSKAYGAMLGMDVAREQARINLPVSLYTEWYWKMDLHNLFHFLELRLDPHAQWEIRQYAEAILGILKKLPEFKWSVEIFEQVREVNTLIRDALNNDKEFERLPGLLVDFNGT